MLPHGWQKLIQSQDGFLSKRIAITMQYKTQEQEKLGLGLQLSADPRAIAARSVAQAMGRRAAGKTAGARLDSAEPAIAASGEWIASADQAIDLLQAGMDSVNYAVSSQGEAIAGLADSADVQGRQITVLLARVSALEADSALINLNMGQKAEAVQVDAANEAIAGLQAAAAGFVTLAEHRHIMAKAAAAIVTMVGLMAVVGSCQPRSETPAIAPAAIGVPRFAPTPAPSPTIGGR